MTWRICGPRRAIDYFRPSPLFSTMFAEATLSTMRRSPSGRSGIPPRPCDAYGRLRRREFRPRDCDTLDLRLARPVLAAAGPIAGSFASRGSGVIAPPDASQSVCVSPSAGIGFHRRLRRQHSSSAAIARPLRRRGAPMWSEHAVTRTTATPGRLRFNVFVAKS